jgi:hypothetical protein
MDFTPATWAALSRLLDEALERDAGARAEWLRRMAITHPDLAPLLRTLLAAHATSVQFNQPVVVYVDNFMDFLPGTIVPLGVFERAYVGGRRLCQPHVPPIVLEPALRWHPDEYIVDATDLEEKARLRQRFQPQCIDAAVADGVYRERATEHFNVHPRARLQLMFRPQEGRPGQRITGCSEYSATTSGHY